MSMLRGIELIIEGRTLFNTFLIILNCYKLLILKAQPVVSTCSDFDFLYTSPDVIDLFRLLGRLTDNVYYQYNSLLKKNSNIIFPTVYGTVQLCGH